eukprot:1138115-Pelagomonas_calceolata.AAC.5
MGQGAFPREAVIPKHSQLWQTCKVRPQNACAVVRTKKNICTQGGQLGHCPARLPHPSTRSSGRPARSGHKPYVQL